MKIALSTLLLLFSLSSFSQLRNTSWGMKAEEVKKIETSKLVREYNGDLTYSLDITDLNCEMEYIFAKNKLVEIKYIFTSVVKERTKENQTAVWVKTYKNIQQKYGDPTIRDNEKLYIWSLNDFSIKASHETSRYLETETVSYTPPSPTQKDVL